MYFCLFFILFSALLLAQEPAAFSNDRYSGVSAVGISPTQPYFNENPWDINAVSGGFFIRNDYAYISGQSLLSLSHTEVETADPKNGITGDRLPGILDFYNKNTANYHFSSDVMGPSVAFSTKIRDKRYVFGLFSRIRTQSSGIDLDNYLRFNNSGTDAPEEYGLKPLKLNAMNWAEIGLHASAGIFPYSGHRWVLGVNLKYEIGLDAAVIDSRQPLTIKHFEATEDTPEQLYFSDYNILASYATGYDFQEKRYRAKPKGHGIGLDAGLAFVDGDEREEEYNFKTAFNILDLGYVNFKGESHLLNGATFDYHSLDDVEIESPGQYLSLVSSEIYGDPAKSLIGSDFSIGLPTAVHLNLSRKVAKHHFVNFDWVQRAPVFKNSLKRVNTASLSYTVQKRGLGLGASASLYEYREVGMGSYIRIGPLIIGSGNIFPLLFKQKKLHSADVFMAFKIYPFWDNDLSRRRRSKCNCD